MNFEPARNLLFVTGILYTILGGLAILLALLLLTVVQGFSIVIILQALFHIYAGILGIASRKHPVKMATLKRIGKIDIGLVGLILYIYIMGAWATAGGFSGFYLIVLVLFIVILLAFRLPLPILYIVGARKNLKAYQKLLEE